MTHDEEIIKEATEIYEKNQNAGALVGDLLRIIKSQKSEIDILIRKKHSLRDEVAEKDEVIKMLKNAYKQCAWERDVYMGESK